MERRGNYSRNRSVIGNTKKMGKGIWYDTRFNLGNQMDTNIFLYIGLVIWKRENLWLSRFGVWSQSLDMKRKNEPLRNGALYSVLVNHEKKLFNGLVWCMMESYLESVFWLGFFEGITWPAMILEFVIYNV